MKTRTIVLLACLITGSFSACKKDSSCGCNQPAEDYLVFGQYYGLCGGPNCVSVYKIEDGVLYEDSGDTYPSDSPYPGNYVALPAAKYDLVKDLTDQIPAQLLNEPSGVIGTPDAYDQGGFIIEVEDAGDIKYWRIDTDKSNIPAYLHAFTDTLRSYINRMQ